MNKHLNLSTQRADQQNSPRQTSANETYDDGTYTVYGTEYDTYGPVYGMGSILKRNGSAAQFKGQNFIVLLFHRKRNV